MQMACHLSLSFSSGKPLVNIWNKTQVDINTPGSLQRRKSYNPQSLNRKLSFIASSKSKELEKNENEKSKNQKEARREKFKNMAKKLPNTSTRYLLCSFFFLLSEITHDG